MGSTSSSSAPPAAPCYCCCCTGRVWYTTGDDQDVQRTSRTGPVQSPSRKGPGSPTEPLLSALDEAPFARESSGTPWWEAGLEDREWQSPNNTNLAALPLSATSEATMGDGSASGVAPSSTTVVAKASARPRSGRRRIAPAAGAEDVATWLVAAFPDCYHAEGRVVGFVPCLLVGQRLVSNGDNSEDKLWRPDQAHSQRRSARLSLASSTWSVDEKGDLEMLADNSSGSEEGSQDFSDTGSCDEDAPLDLPPWLETRSGAGDGLSGASQRKPQPTAHEALSSDDGLSDVSSVSARHGANAAAVSDGDASSGGFSDVSAPSSQRSAPRELLPPASVPAQQSAVESAAVTTSAVVSAPPFGEQMKGAESDGGSAFSDVSAPSCTGRTWPPGYRSKEERVAFRKKAKTWSAPPAKETACALQRERAKTVPVQAPDSDSGFSDVSDT